MNRVDEVLILAGIVGGMALTLMLGVRVISPTRFAQGLAGGLAGLALAKLVVVLGGADHG